MSDESEISRFLLNAFSSLPLEEKSIRRTRYREVENKININTIDLPNQIVIFAEVPGVLKEDIVVNFYNNIIKITAKKVNPLQNADIQEIAYGTFEREIKLPVCVTQKETVNVSLRQGVLKITIDKTMEERNKFTIKIDNED